MQCLRDRFNENLFFIRLPGTAFVVLLLFASSNLTAQLATTDKQLSEIDQGEITLSIGDGFIFGESDARPDGDRSKLDLYVQDIRHGVSLAAFAGCTYDFRRTTERSFRAVGFAARRAP
jgi:hypothetical protein